MPQGHLKSASRKFFADELARFKLLRPLTFDITNSIVLVNNDKSTDTIPLSEFDLFDIEIEFVDHFYIIRKVEGQMIEFEFEFIV